MLQNLSLQNYLIRDEIVTLHDRSVSSTRDYTLENACCMQYVFNLQTGYFEYISPSCEMVTGYVADEIIAMGMEGFVKNIMVEDVSRLNGFAEMFWEQLMLSEVQYRLNGSDGVARMVNEMRYIKYDSMGEPQILFATIHCI